MTNPPADIDIVERLSNLARFTQYGSNACALAVSAAAEIERLRREVETLRADRRVLAEEVKHGFIRHVKFGFFGVTQNDEQAAWAEKKRAVSATDATGRWEGGRRERTQSRAGTDAMIAEKVMGWEPLPIIHTDDFGPKSRAYRVPINGREKHV